MCINWSGIHQYSFIHHPHSLTFLSVSSITPIPRHFSLDRPLFRLSPAESLKANMILAIQTFEDCTFEWLYWPQAKQPYDPNTLKYINLLDADMDIQLLKSYGWTLSAACSRVLQISTMLLKKGAAAGLTPYEIACMMCRESLNKPSVIENIVEQAKESILPECSEVAFLEVVSQIMDFHIEKAKCTQK